MRSTLLIRYIAVLLAISFVCEIAASLHYEVAISIEIDTDTEEESKEDKPKEYTLSPMPICVTRCIIVSKPPIYIITTWSSPTLDNLKQPPELA